MDMQRWVTDADSAGNPAELGQRLLRWVVVVAGVGMARVVEVIVESGWWWWILAGIKVAGGDGRGGGAAARRAAIYVSDRVSVWLGGWLVWLDGWLVWLGGWLVCWVGGSCGWTRCWLFDSDSAPTTGRPT